MNIQSNAPTLTDHWGLPRLWLYRQGAPLRGNPRSSVAGPQPPYRLGKLVLCLTSAQARLCSPLLPSAQARALLTPVSRARASRGALPRAGGRSAADVLRPSSYTTEK